MDRLSRFTIPGIAFIVTLCYFVYSLSGHNLLSSSDDNLLTLIAGILSTPVIGLIVTSILHTVIHRLPFNGKPGPYWLFLPRDLDQEIFDAFSEGQVPTSKQEWEKFYWKYQQTFRSDMANEKVIDFTANRWTYYFVLVNSAFGVLFGVLISVFFVWWQFLFIPRPGFLVAGLIVSLLFSVIGFWLSRFSLNDAREVEHLDILEKVRKRKKNP